MPRLKVVHAAKFYPPVSGGMETVIGDLCSGMADAWDVCVVAANTGPSLIRERREGVQIVRAPAWGVSHSVPLCPLLPVHLWRQNADCVVLHEPNPIAGTALFLHTPAPRLVIWHHSDLVRPAWAPHTYGRVQRALYRRAECVIVSSPTLAESSDLIRHAQRVAVVPFGVPLERYRPVPALCDAAERLRARNPGPHVLFVGRLVYYKGVEVLLDAMARCPGTLVLVGEGPLEPALRTRAAALGIEHRVIFAGRVPDDQLPAWYRAADVFVLPSVARTEAFGVVQVEAMASGVPVVSTKLPTGVPWVNQDGVSGIVVPPGDAAALAHALNRLLEDAELRARLGRGAVARAAAHFSRERMIAAFRGVVEAAVHAREQTEAGAGVAKLEET
jgi:rhamnosyl/mannosyltransferase